MKFPNYNGGRAITVTAPTQAQRALYATSGANGEWLSILEKAFIAEAPNQSPFNIKSNWFQSPKNPYDRLANKAAGASINFLTGDTKKTIDASGDKLDLATVIKYLFNSYDKTSPDRMKPMTVPIVAISKDNKAWYDLEGQSPARKKLLTPLHAYAVIGFNPGSYQVLLQNPHGEKDATFGTTFFMPLDQFLQEFISVSFAIPK